MTNQKKRQEGETTPTLDRIKEVYQESQSIGYFLDWLQDQGVVLCRRRYNDDEDHWGELWHPILESPDRLLHQYFDIDPNAEDKEKLMILEEIRKG